MREPTKPMREAAASAGFYQSSTAERYPRIQLLTVGELLAGKGIDMPRWEAIQTFKQAPRVKEKPKGTPSLPGIDAGENE
jgi:hypothetical protein